MKDILKIVACLVLATLYMADDKIAAVVICVAFMILSLMLYRFDKNDADEESNKKTK